MVIDVDEDLVLPVLQVAYHPGYFLQFLIPWLDDLIPVLACALLHCFPVGAMQSYYHRIRQSLPELPVRSKDRRHIVALQEDVAQAVFGKKIEILAPQPVRIPDLDAVMVTLRHPLEEHLEQFEEMMEAGHLHLVEVLELEHQWADMVTQRFNGLEEPRHQAGGEKMRIGNEG